MAPHSSHIAHIERDPLALDAQATRSFGICLQLLLLRSSSEDKATTTTVHVTIMNERRRRRQTWISTVRTRRNNNALGRIPAHLWCWKSRVEYGRGAMGGVAQEGVYDAG